MEDEFKNFIKVWLTAIASLTYCYFISAKIPKGKLRLLSLLPVITLFTFLPLQLSSVHLSGITGFFISWLANFKLLLFAFNQGPLFSNPLLSLPLFISLACLPIKIKTTPSPQTIKSSLNQQNSQYPSSQFTAKNSNSTLGYAIKGVLFALLMQIYEYKQHIHPTFLLFLYCFHVYFLLEFILAISAAMAKSLLGIELEPQADAPYLATSLQDFWGRRWNLMVTNILRPSVYNPTKLVLSRHVGKRWALIWALLATFMVSGLMHELIFFYLGRVWPTWEVMWFFALHGVSLVVEIMLKKVLQDTWRLHPVVSVPLTVGFVVVTGFWLFFPQLLSSGADVKGIEEFNEMVEFVKNVVQKVISSAA